MAAKRKAPTRRKLTRVNWEAVEHQYVTSGEPVSHRALSAEHNISTTSIGRESSRRGWVEKRERYWAEVAEKALLASADDQADDMAEDITTRNASLGQAWYELAEAALESALAAEKASERQANSISAGIATEKWRLVTGQNTAKAEQIIRGPYDDLTDDEATELLEESVEVIRYSRQAQQNSAPATRSTGAVAGEPSL